MGPGETWSPYSTGGCKFTGAAHGPGATDGILGSRVSMNMHEPPLTRGASHTRILTFPARNLSSPVASSERNTSPATPGPMSRELFHLEIASFTFGGAGCPSNKPRNGPFQAKALPATRRAVAKATASTQRRRPRRGDDVRSICASNAARRRSRSAGEAAVST